MFHIIFLRRLTNFFILTINREIFILIFYSGVNLKGANLEGSNMAGVHLRVATLKNANLQHCDLRAAVLAGADLEVRIVHNSIEKFYRNTYI